jgi:hypothetical protein
VIDPVLEYSTYLGGDGDDVAGDISVDAMGNVYVTGTAHGPNFPTANSLQQNWAGDVDAFVAKLSADGSRLLYSTYLGGRNDDVGDEITVDALGNAYVTGWTDSADFPTASPLQTVLGGTQDAFVTNLDATGSMLQYSPFLGGGQLDHGNGIAVDHLGDAYVAGETDSPFPTVNALQPVFGGWDDAFIAKIGELDGDRDGVDNSLENGAPSDGDGNIDGVADSVQANVVSLPSTATGGYVTLESAGRTTLTLVTTVENPSPGDVPQGVAFPLAFFEFSVNGIGAGATTSVGLFVPEGIELNSYYKYGPTLQNNTPHWYEFMYDGTTGAEILQDRILLHFVDGQRGDDDLSADGEIREPGGPAQILSGFYFPQFADGAAGNIQFQSTLILANTGSATAARVEFYGTPDGAPMWLALGDLRMASIFEFTLDEGESVSLSTLGAGDLQVGYARVLAGVNVGGVVVFRRTDLTTGVSLYEAGIPASTELTEFCLFVDSLGVRDTGFALVYPPHDQGNPSAQAADANVTLRLYDKQYKFIAESTLDPLAPGSHLAKFVHEMFDDPEVKAQAQEMEGILVVRSDQPLVAVTVRQNDHPHREFPQEVPILTTFPVMPGAPD